MTLTLEKLHKDLDVKQGLKNYVRNTNNKYGTNFEATEPLDRNTYMLIKYNTLGKLKRHGQQAKFIAKFVQYEKEVKALIEEVTLQQERLQKAVTVIGKDNLKDSYIETLKMQSKFTKDFGVTDEVIAFLEKNGVRYAKFMIAHGVETFFNERIEWFEKELAK